MEDIRSYYYQIIADHCEDININVGQPVSQWGDSNKCTPSWPLAWSGLVWPGVCRTPAIDLTELARTGRMFHVKYQGRTRAGAPEAGRARGFGLEWRGQWSLSVETVESLRHHTLPHPGHPASAQSSLIFQIYSNKMWQFHPQQKMSFSEMLKLF